MLCASTNNYFSILPVELVNIVIDCFDVMTLTNFISTCKFYRMTNIKYIKTLYIKDQDDICPTFSSLKWCDDPASIKKMYSNSCICLQVNCLIDYHKTCKYQYMYATGIFPNRKTFGFFTNLPIYVLQSKDFICYSNYYNVYYSNNIKDVHYSRIIDFGEYRQVKFKNICESKIIRFLYKTQYFIIGVHNDSEFVMDRHPLYAKNNIVVEHTTTKYIKLDGIRYFISCYTEALDLTKWRPNTTRS